MVNFITLNQDLLTSNSSISSYGLNILEKGIEAMTGMRHPLDKQPCQFISSTSLPVCHLFLQEPPYLMVKEESFIHISYSGRLDVN